MKKLLSICMVLLLLADTVAGCTRADPQQNTSSTETPAPAEPVTVTMFGYWTDVKGSGQFDSFHTALSAKYPEITLEYEAFPTGTFPYTDELTRRLEHGEEADIIMAADTSLSGSGKLIDLTEQAFTDRYSLAAMKQLSLNGSVYFLPGVGSVQCYIYNLTQLEELKLDPPQTLDQMEEMMRVISEAGGHPFLVPYEQTRPLFMKALSAGYLATPEGQIWMEDYNNGKATMKGNPHWEAVWQRAERMVNAGYLTKEDSTFAEGRRITTMAQGIGSMSTISSSLSGFLQENNQNNYQFLLLPLLGEKPENRTVFCAPTTYFAASSRLNQPENAAKRDAVLKIFDFISTKEGQDAIRGDAPLSNSYLRDVEFQLDPHAQAIAEVLREGSFGIAPTFARGVETVLGDVFGKMINGEMTADQALEACDKQNATYQVEAAAPPPAVVGTAAEEFPWTYRKSRTQELAVTNFVTDSIKKAAGTEIALELGTAVRGEFFKGEITEQDIVSVIRLDKKLYRVQVTGQQIWDLIEQGITADNSSWFVTVAGLSYRYQPVQGETPGKLLSITTPDGSALDLGKSYEIAVSENQLAEVANVYTFYPIKGEEIGMTLREAVIRNIKEQGSISPVLDGRIQVAQ